MKKRSTISEIARAAGVGTATVDRVLNDRGNVRDDTKRKVYDAAVSVGYHAVPLLRERLQSNLPVRKLGLLLQKENQEFYQSFAQAFEDHVLTCPEIRGRAEVVFAKSQDPHEHASLMAELGRRNHAIAATAVNHPEVSRTVQDLQEHDTPVFSLLNDFGQGQTHAYVGLDNMKIGRIAGWAIRSVARRQGKIAVFVGGSRWHGHELRETGFRSYLREHSAHHELLETLVNLETRNVTYEATLDLLHRHPDLSGIFVAGGGMEGAIQAVRECRAPGEVAMVVNELTRQSQGALQDGYVSLISSTPLQRLCKTLVQAMAQAVSDSATGEPRQIFLQPEIYVPESL